MSPDDLPEPPDLQRTTGMDLPGAASSPLARYEILREIGRGGMGVVYEARDDRLQRHVALKVLPADSIDADARARFLSEARAAAALNHPNIVAVHDAGESEGRPFLVMEYVPGESFADTPPRDLDEALAFAADICNALEHAHSRGLVHRDLKPGNVLIAREADPPIVKLADMGIALSRGSVRVTRSGAFLGTPSFTAPEQALGRDVDGRTDLYSLGVMLYQWTTGRLPFEGDDALAVISQHIHAPVVPPRTYRPDLPCGLEPLILRLLAKDPDARPATAAEVREAIAAVGTPAEGDPEEARGGALPVAIEALTRGRLVGRAAELEQLQELWTRVGQGASHLALVSGEPGIGKTRLAFELMASAQMDGALALLGGCYENEATTPYLPFVEAFRRLVRERGDEELGTALGDTAAEIARLAPEVGERLGPFPERPALAPQEERLRLFDAVARFLRRLAARRGLLFFLDDLQWADHGSLALLHYLLRDLASDRVLFLGTYRELELDRAHALSKALVDWNRERLATRVRLDRLDRDATARMIATLLGQEDISDAFVDSLHRETEGNPFFVEEILKALIAEGDLIHEGTTWRRRTTGEFLLPQSVKAAIGSRLEQVSETATEVLRTAAVIGKVFEFGELLSAAARSEDEILDALDEAAAAQLVAARSGETFAFTHDKIREVLYEEINPIRRRRLHARIAAGMEEMMAAGRTVAVEELAHHWVESGDYGKGLQYSREAAEAARRVFAWSEMLGMLLRARECAEALEQPDEVIRIDELMGDTATLDGDMNAAIAHYERALAAERSPERINELRAKCAEVCVSTLNPGGREYARLVMQEADPERQPGPLAAAMTLEARYRHVAGELDDALALYRQAQPIAEAAGDPQVLVMLYSYMAGTLQHRADLAESDECARRCIAVGEEHGIPEGVLLGYEFLSENAFNRGDWKGNIAWARKERKLAEEVHNRVRLAWTRVDLFGLGSMGRLTEFQEQLEAGLEMARRIGDRRLELFLRFTEGLMLVDTGRAAEAERLFADLIREADEHTMSAHQIACRGGWVYALQRLGRLDEAVAEARTAIRLWKERNSRGMGLQVPSLARAFVRAGHLDEARELLDAHEAIARPLGAPVRMAQNHHMRALLAAREGRPEQALPLLDEAIDTFAAGDSHLDLVMALVDRAELLAAAGRGADAAADRERAAVVARECGAAETILEPLG